jgi:hypothetical protein
VIHEVLFQVVLEHKLNLENVIFLGGWVVVKQRKKRNATCSVWFLLFVSTIHLSNIEVWGISQSIDHMQPTLG